MHVREELSLNFRGCPDGRRDAGNEKVHRVCVRVCVYVTQVCICDKMHIVTSIRARGTCLSVSGGVVI